MYVHFLSLSPRPLLTSDSIQVQDIVVGNKQFGDGAMPSDLASILLNDDVDLTKLGEEAAANPHATAASVAASKQKEHRPLVPRIPLDAWNDDGDDFFGHTAAPNASGVTFQDGTAPGTPQPLAPTDAPVKKKRGRKPSHKKKAGPATGDALNLGGE